MALRTEQDQCREGSITSCLSSGLGLPHNMLDAGVHVGEVLGPALACNQFDSPE